MEFDYDTYFAYERKETNWDDYYEYLSETEDREYEDNYEEEN